MSSFLAMLAQQTPNLQTRKGLILLGLQNDFLSSEGKLPVSTKSGFLDRLKELVPAFREFGDVIWVRSEFEATRIVNVEDDNGCTVIAGSSVSDAVAATDRTTTTTTTKRKASQDLSAQLKRVKAAEVEEDDPELFLTRTARREPACVKGSWGADYPADVKALVDDRDMQVVKTYYSAFGSTSLLLTLRSKLITELYVCGCNTNLSVFATAMDAARYGISITLIEDCLGYRKRERHDEAIRQLVEIMEADVTTSKKAIDVLKNPPSEDEDDEDDEESEDDTEEPVRIDEEGPEARQRALLAVDSDSNEEEEEEEGEDQEPIVPNVRSSRQPFGLALRYISSRSAEGSRSAAAATTRAQTPTQSAEPAHAGLPNSSRRAVGSVPAARSAGERHASRGGADGVESPVPELTGRRVARNAHDVMAAIAAGRAGSTRMAGSSIASPQATLSTRRSANEVLATTASSRPESSHDSMASSKAALSTSTTKLPPPSHPDFAALSTFAGLYQRTTNDSAKAMPEETRTAPTPPTSHPLFGADKEQESAGSRIQYNLLPPDLAATIFATLNNTEITWQHMHHLTGAVPRLVCCQGDISAVDGSRPVYRHPADQTLPLHAWTPTVERVRQAAEDGVGHRLNHVLIQLYRDGSDFISEHSDKTLDIALGSTIVNVSFGAQRTMRLRTKRGAASSASATEPATTVTTTALSAVVSPTRTTYRVPLPHNSMVTMTLPTNAEYLHAITADKRPGVELSEAETAYGGQRISLTFRQIGTYLSADEERIWGRGATGKTREEAKPVINGDEAASEKLVRAFGRENQAVGEMKWEDVYGEGFDVLHLR